jgi:hypothetical protein
MKKKQLLKILVVPYHSVMLGLSILGGGIADLCKSVRVSFRRGPWDELGSYVREISKYVEDRYGTRLKRKKRNRKRQTEPKSVSTNETNQSIRRSVKQKYRKVG